MPVTVSVRPLTRSPVARSDVVDEIERALGGSAPVVLVGSAGVGKTWLLRTIAERHAWPLCDVAGIEDPAELVDTVGVRDVSAPLSQGIEPLVALAEHIDEASVGLVIDGVEPGARAFDVVAELHALLPATRMVVGARAALPLRDATVVGLPGLPCADAADAGPTLLAHFADRIGAPAVDGAAAARLAAAVLGLPLALRLAAGLLTRHEPDALLSRLASCGIDPIDALVDVALEGLDPGPRRVLEEASCFRRTVLTRVLRGELGTGQVTRSLDELARLGLVERGAATRLQAPVRDRVYRRLRERGAHREVLDRHARAVVRLLSSGGDAQGEVGGDAQGEVGDDEGEAAALLPEALACIEWTLGPDSGERASGRELARGLFERLHFRGSYRLHLSILDRVLASAPPEMDAVSAELRLHRGQSRRCVGWLEESAMDFTDVERWAERSREPRLFARAIIGRALTHIRAGQAADAVVLLTALHEHERTSGDPRRALFAHGNLTVARAEAGPEDPSESTASLVDEFRALSQRYEQLGAARVARECMCSVGIEHLRHGSLAEATEVLRWVVDEPGETGAATRGNAALYLAWAHLEQGRHVDAGRALAEAERWLRPIGERAALALGRALGARLHADEGQIDRAEHVMLEAEGLLLGAHLPVVRTALAVLRGHLEIGQARLALDRDDRIGAGDQLAAARRRLAAAEAGRKQRMGVDVWLALSSLEAALSGFAPLAGPLPIPEPGRLVLSKDGRSMRGLTGETVDLERRPVIRRLIRALAEARRTRPGDALPPEALVACVWPGERMLPRAATNRLHVAISTSRRLGLGRALEHHEGGYRLSPTVSVDFV